jgi:hypothetical protein
VKSSIARVVVSLDVASENAPAIDTAARLAAHWQADLHGVFVEDEDLLSLASLPFARQITLHSGAEPLTAESVEGHFRAAAALAQQALAAAAANHGVSSSFEIVRGAPAGGSLGTTGGDLIVACSLTRPIDGHFRVECRWWSSAGAIPGSLLLARRSWDAAGPVLALLRDREPASERVLEAAASIAEVQDGALTLICLPGIAGGEGFDRWIADRLATHSLRLQIEPALSDLSALQSRIAEFDCRVLVVEAATRESDAKRLRDLSERLSCDLLFVP